METERVVQGEENERGYEKVCQMQGLSIAEVLIRILK